MEQNMEKSNNFLAKYDNKKLFCDFPNEHIYTVKFTPKFTDKNTLIVLSKYAVIEDNEVFLYE